MPEQHSFQIVDVRKLPSPDPQRLGKEDAIVVYALDPTHHYTVRIPAEELSEETIRQAVRRDIEERSKWLGKTISL